MDVQSEQEGYGDGVVVGVGLKTQQTGLQSFKTCRTALAINLARPEAVLGVWPVVVECDTEDNPKFIHLCV